MLTRHPSESIEFLLTRLLAYCLEFAEGIEFSRGLSDPDNPAIAVRDLTGHIRSWIEVGSPDATRLHKASKASPRVAVYTHTDPTQLLKGLSRERIHRVEEIELWVIDRAFVNALATRLDRRMTFSLSVIDRELYLAIGSDSLTGTITRHPLLQV